MSEPALRILMVVEAPADARTVATLVDKVLVESQASPDWFDEEHLLYLRAWVGDGSKGGDLPHVTWTHLKKRGPRRLGHGLQGPVKHPYAEAARRAIKVGLLAPSRPTALVLVVDTDSQPGRRDGLDEARKAEDPSIRVVVGAADPKREAWVLNAFEPRSHVEQSGLEELRKELGFDPCKDAHRLRGKRNETRDIKQVLRTLVDDAADREIDALVNPPLEQLIERGSSTGLSAFLEEAETLCDLLEADSGR